jgi:hypothetical protein
MYLALISLTHRLLFCLYNFQIHLTIKQSLKIWVLITPPSPDSPMQQEATLASWIREEASMWVFAGVSSALGALMLLDAAMH